MGFAPTLSRARKRWATLGLTVAAALIASVLVAAPAQALSDTGTGGVFVPASGRIFDTKNNIGGYNTPMPAKAWRTLAVAGKAGIPDDGSVGAVSVVATLADICSQGTLYGRPNADETTTMMGIYGGVDKQNTSFSAALAVNSDGTIQVETETTARLILDVQGYYTADTDGTAPGGFVPLNGKRIVDTRSGLGATKAIVGPGKSIDVQVTGTAGVPAGASAAIVNLLAVPSGDAAGYFTPYPTGGTRPSTSLAYATGVPTSMQAQVKLSSSGKITVYNSGGTTNIVVDVQGYFTATGGAGSVFTPAASRIYDSRTSGNTALGKNETRSISVAGVGGVPVMGSGITAVVLTLTSLKATPGTGIATVWADGTTRPNTSSLNFDETTIRTNTITVPLGTNGKISLDNNADVTNYVINVQGWYIDPIAPTISCPVPFTAGTWTNTLPQSSISCTVRMPNTGDSEGILSVSINGQSTEDVTTTGTADTTYTAVIPATAGWHTIEATSVYSGNMSGNTRYEFGLNAASPSALLATVQAANPGGFVDVAADAVTGSGVAATLNPQNSQDGSASIATNPANGVSLTTVAQTSTDPETGNSVSIPAKAFSAALPFAAQAENGHLESPGIVSFDNKNGSSTLAVLKTDASVQLNTVISGPQAPTSFAYPLNIPAGASASIQSDGSVTVSDSSGTTVGGVAPAWALDADGKAVPTRYILDGNTLRQVVDHDSSTTYPVVADPYMGLNIVKSVEWVRRSSEGLTLKVYPTLWGRSMAGLDSANKAGWAEVTKRAPSANTKYMRWQYDCHSAIAWWKSSWNLDDWKKRSSYAEFTKHLCN